MPPAVVRLIIECEPLLTRDGGRLAFLTHEHHKNLSFEYVDEYGHWMLMEWRPPAFLESSDNRCDLWLLGLRKLKRVIVARLSSLDQRLCLKSGGQSLIGCA